jgi:hypothetical protein
MNSWGEICAIIMSIIMTPILLIAFPDISEAARLLVMAGFSVVACLFGIFVFGPEDEKVLKSFYDKVKPLGFWGRFAPDNKHQKLKNAITSMLLCAFSIFSLLVGFGTLLINAPSPNWIGQGLWISLNLILGLLAIPFWYRLGFKKA